MSSKQTITNILIVDKSGSIKELAVKKLAEEEFYKKAGYKSAEGFKCHTTWAVEIDGKSYVISLYGKITGRANQENKYEFPPPVDKLLFFGNCLLVNNIEGGKIADLTSKEWEDIYEKLYGGFEDIGDEDSEDDEDEDEDDDDADDLKLTKSGYAKDGFIVDDEDEEEEEEEDEDEEEEEEEEDEEDDDIPKIKAKKVSIKKKAPKKSKSGKLVDLPVLLKKDEEEETFLDCKSELSEESYIE